MRPVSSIKIIVILLAATILGCGGSPQNEPKPTQRQVQDSAAGGRPTPTSAAVIDPLLLIGEAPPPIRVAKWIKGAPLTSFEKGRVYVVDFWATWCGPCKAAIPHLSELQQRHGGRVEVIGVAISERQKDEQDTSYIERVEKFVEKQGERMNYRVAVDTPTKTMHATWFKPTGTGGIPTAYIIDQNGLVAWTGIGLPAVIERIVDEVLAGSFDHTKELARQKAEEESAGKRSEADIAAAKTQAPDGTDRYARYPGYREAMARGDQAAALECLNAAFKADPESEVAGAYQWKFMILLQRAGGGARPDEVNQYVRELLEKYPANDDIMGFASACIVSMEEEQRFDKDLALRTATIAADLARPDSRWAQFAKMRLGWAYYHTGDREKAIVNMRAALDGVTRLKDQHDFGDLALQCEDALKQFQKPAK
ncbi:MAG: redoxin domain-containing protein [Phycisphaerales bacterium]|nr:redoxin domain-containing protein [Phycisphaerales bacterium]